MAKRTREEQKVADAIGRRLTDARLASGLGQEDVAERAETNASSISRYERGEQIPGIIKLSKIAAVYGRTLESFTTGDDALSQALGEEPTAQQLRAAKIVGALSDEITDGWLRSLEVLLPIVQASGALQTVEERPRERRRRRQS